MTKKFEMTLSIPTLMMQRVGAAEMRGLSMEARLPDEVIKWNQVHDDLGIEIRARLQAEGFVKDCEIDSHMEYLAIQLAKAHSDLAFYISKNSVTLADEAAALGITSMRDWQDSHPSPIRPDRRH